MDRVIVAFCILLIIASFFIVIRALVWQFLGKGCGCSGGKEEGCSGCSSCTSGQCRSCGKTKKQRQQN